MLKPAHGAGVRVVRLTYGSAQMLTGAHALQLILEALAVRREGVRPLPMVVDESFSEHQF